MTIIARRDKNIFDLPASNHVSERVLIVCEDLRDENEVRLATRKIIIDNGYINAVSVRYIESLYEEFTYKASSHMDELVVKTVVVRTAPSDPDLLGQKAFSDSRRRLWGLFRKY
jgi:hypothetical protein